MLSDLPEAYLCDYYDKIYPTKTVLKWLKYNKPVEYLQHREIALILGDDTHLRYRVFLTEEEFKRDLIRVKPHKIDIGAVYNHRPDKRLNFKNDFKAVERELVFDIDLTDYDSIRNCCTGANICQACWRWMVLAVKVLERILKKHFGFKHMLFLFSGRRGVHCWVADDAARKLDNSGRGAVAEYISLISGTKRVVISDKYTHPMLEDAYEAIMETNEIDKLVIEQKWLEEGNWEELLSFCRDEQFRQLLRKDFEALSTAENRWKLLKRRFDKGYREKLESENVSVPNPAPDNVKNFLKEFVLQYAHPRLDVNVSTGTNHLLKSPFCIHPKTGKIAVPINPKTVDKFNPENVPTITKLMDEMQKLSSAVRAEDSKENVTLSSFLEHCSLKPYLEAFESFVDDAVNSDD